MVRITICAALVALVFSVSAMAQSTRPATMPATQPAMPVESPASEAAAVAQQFLDALAARKLDEAAALIYPAEGLSPERVQASLTQIADSIAGGDKAELQDSAKSGEIAIVLLVKTSGEGKRYTTDPLFLQMHQGSPRILMGPTPQARAARPALLQWAESKRIRMQ